MSAPTAFLAYSRRRSGVTVYGHEKHPTRHGIVADNFTCVSDDDLPRALAEARKRMSELYLRYKIPPPNFIEVGKVSELVGRAHHYGKLPESQ